MYSSFGWSRYRFVAVGLLSGALLGAGSVWFALWPLSLLSFVGVTYLLHEAPRRQVGWYLAVVGVAAYGCSYAAMYWSILPLDWLGIGLGSGALLVGSVWLLTVSIFASVFGFLLRVAAGRGSGLWTTLALVPSLYVLVDAGGALLFSLVFAGSFSTLGVDHTMGSPGYQLADSDLLRHVAWAGGLYGLVFVQAAFGVVGYYVVRATGRWRWWYRSGWVLVWGVLASNVLSVPAQPIATDTPTVSVGVVSTFDSEFISATPAEQLQFAVFRLPSDIDVIALPEDTRYVQYMDAARAEQLATYFTNAYVLDSGSIPTATGLQPEIQVYDTGARRVATSSKEFLMVFGEYLPWVYQGLGTLFGLDSVLTQLQEEHRYQVTDPQPLAIEGIPISVKLCSDAISPAVYQRDTRAGATILFNLASHGWFHHSRALQHMAVRGGQVRAVENGRWYIRAGHDSPSLVIDQRGVVVAAHRWFEIEPLAVNVPVLSHRTLYAQIGVWVLALPLFGVLVYLIGRRFRACKSSHKQ